MKPIINIKIGDSVIVKPTIQDPDFGLDIGGWQGRVSDVVEGGEVILIEWDSLTLKDLPDSMIAKCEEDGLSWDEMYLPVIEIELTAARDSKEDVTQIMSQIHAHHTWDHLGEEGRGIQKILDHVDPEDERAILQAWEAHFRKVLHFPFEAEVAEPQDRGRFKTGDRVVVREITAIDEMYGILVEIQYKREVLTFPLCDLEAKDKNSPNYKNVKLYVVWFANR
jgi:Calcium binding